MHYCVRTDLTDDQARADACATSQILFNVSNRLASLHSNGSRSAEVHRERDAVLRSLVFAGLQDTRLKSAYTRVLAISDRDVEEGIRLVGTKTHVELNAGLGGGDRKRQRRSDAMDLDVVVHYMHNDDGKGCALVSPDKNHQVKFKGKKARVGGKDRILTCPQKRRRGTKRELVEDFFGSSTWENYRREHPEHSLSFARAQSCICDCIKPETATECSCPYCTGMSLRLEALDAKMRQLRERFRCECCPDDCAWVAATKSTGNFISEVRFWRPTRPVQRVSVGSAHLHFHTESRSIRMTKTRKIFIVFVTMRLEPVEADYVQENSASGTVFLQSIHGT